MPTSASETLYGTGGADTLDGQSAPAGSGDYLQGNGGADTFVFKPGYGHLEVNENEGYAGNPVSARRGDRHCVSCCKNEQARDH